MSNWKGKEPAHEQYSLPVENHLTHNPEDPDDHTTTKNSGPREFKSTWQYRDQEAIRATLAALATMSTQPLTAPTPTQPATAPTPAPAAPERVYYKWDPATKFPDFAPDEGVWMAKPPPMESWCSLMGYAPGEEDAADVWITYARLKYHRDSPLIPWPYEQEEAEQRVVMIRGFPNEMTASEVRHVMSRVANIERVVALVSIGYDTFRWLIFRTNAEAEQVRTYYNGTRYEGRDVQVRLIQSPPPVRERRTWCLALKGDSLADWNFNGELQDEQDMREAEWRRQQEREAGWRAKQETQVGSEMEGQPPRSQPETIHGHPEQFTTVPANETSASAVENNQVAVPKIQVTSTDAELPPSPETVIHNPLDNFITQATSWANIANAANLENRIIDLHPEERERKPSRLQSIGRIPTVASVRAANAESEKELMRVVFLIDIPNNITLQMVSDAIREGPLRSINFGIDAQTNKRYVGVVFQHAEDAEKFHQVLVNEKENSSPGRFRFVVDTGRDTFHSDDIIKAMGAPTWASRRLTLVKGGFFFLIGERDLKRFLEKIVDPEKIQKVHLYNGGNATVIFADVASAIHVKKQLDELAETHTAPGTQPSVWLGLQTTFSKDPCVQPPLDFKTAMHE